MPTLALFCSLHLSIRIGGHAAHPTDHPAQNLRTAALGRGAARLCVEGIRCCKLLLSGRTLSYRYSLLPASLTLQASLLSPLLCDM